jgi:hypothetical protein
MLLLLLLVLQLLLLLLVCLRSALVGLQAALSMGWLLCLPIMMLCLLCRQAPWAWLACESACVASVSEVPCVCCASVGDVALLWIVTQPCIVMQA